MNINHQTDHNEFLPCFTVLARGRLCRKPSSLFRRAAGRSHSQSMVLTAQRSHPLHQPLIFTSCSTVPSSTFSGTYQHLTPALTRGIPPFWARGQLQSEWACTFVNINWLSQMNTLQFSKTGLFSIEHICSLCGMFTRVWFCSQQYCGNEPGAVQMNVSNQDFNQSRDTSHGNEGTGHHIIQTVGHLFLFLAEIL